MVRYLIIFVLPSVLSKPPCGSNLLSAEYEAALDIIKLSDYLITGTKQQFWEEHFVKVIMQGWSVKITHCSHIVTQIGVTVTDRAWTRSHCLK